MSRFFGDAVTLAVCVEQQQRRMPYFKTICASLKECILSPYWPQERETGETNITSNSWMSAENNNNLLPVGSRLLIVVLLVFDILLRLDLFNTTSRESPDITKSIVLLEAESKTTELSNKDVIPASHRPIVLPEAETNKTKELSSKNAVPEGSDPESTAYLNFRFQRLSSSHDPFCASELLSGCDVIYDAECFHKCEGAFFHRLESCLVKHFGIFEMARQTPTSQRGCLLYNNASWGYLSNGIIDLVTRDYPPHVQVVPYEYPNDVIKRSANGCMQDWKRGRRDVCFLVQPNSKVISTTNKCEGMCKEDDVSRLAQGLQNEFYRTYGRFDKLPRNDLVILLDRRKDKRRESRAFANTTAIVTKFKEAGFNFHVYKGDKSSLDNSTVHMFGSAKVVIGYHGAGFVNMIYSHLDGKTVAIEMFARKCEYQQYFNNRIAHWGLQWQQLVVGDYHDATTADEKKSCKWIEKIYYSEDDLNLIVDYVRAGLEV